MPRQSKHPAERPKAPDRKDADAALQTVLTRLGFDRAAFDAEKQALMKLKQERPDDAPEDRGIG